MIRFIIFCLFIIPFHSLLAQPIDSIKVYQLSGLVIGKESQEIIPFVKVQVNHSSVGDLSNKEGFYSLPVTEKDTVYFEHVVYKRTKLIIRDYLKEYKNENGVYLYVITYMREDTISLPLVKIFPYNNNEEVKTALVNMDMVRTLNDQARENMDPKILHAIMQSMDADEAERYFLGRQMYYQQYNNHNVIPTAGFNAMAAMRLLRYIVNESKEKRRKKNLNYWE